MTSREGDALALSGLTATGMDTHVHRGTSRTTACLQVIQNERGRLTPLATTLLDRSEETKK